MPGRPRTSHGPVLGDELSGVCTACFELIQADRWGKLNLRVLEMTAAGGEEGAAAQAALRNREMRRVPTD